MQRIRKLNQLKLMLTKTEVQFGMKKKKTYQNFKIVYTIMYINNN